MSPNDPQRLATHRRIAVKGSGGVNATVVVTVQRARVWLSIQPPFTWDAIMEPEKVDELIAVLDHAKEDAQRNAQQECEIAPAVETRLILRGRTPVALPPLERRSQS